MDPTYTRECALQPGPQWHKQCQGFYILCCVKLVHGSEGTCKMELTPWNSVEGLVCMFANRPTQEKSQVTGAILHLAPMVTNACSMTPIHLAGRPIQCMPYSFSLTLLFDFKRRRSQLCTFPEYVPVINRDVQLSAAEPSES